MTATVGFLTELSAARTAHIQSLLPPDYHVVSLAGGDFGDPRALFAASDYLITGGAHAVTRELLESGKHLKLVHKWGVGVDEIDLAAARELGIKVARTTGSNAIPVAEFTVGLMLALARHIPRGHIAMQDGRWTKGELSPSTFMLNNRVVGIVGMGAIGRHVATRVKAFGSRVIYNSRTRLDPAKEAELGIEWRELPALLAECDVLSLNCPLTKQTEGLIGAAQLAMMKPNAVLVNVARGGVVVEDDLVAALKAGTIAGAALDVFAQEPPPADHPLLAMHNVIVTPHLAGACGDNMPNEIAHMLRNIKAVAAGEPVTPADSVV